MILADNCLLLLTYFCENCDKVFKFDCVEIEYEPIKEKQEEEELCYCDLCVTIYNMNNFFVRKLRVKEKK